VPAASLIEILPAPAPDMPISIRFLDRSVEASALLQGVLNASRDCISVVSLDGALAFMNTGGQAIMEIDDLALAQGQPWLSFWEGEHRDAAMAALAEAKQGRAGHFVGWGKTAKRNPKWWDVTVTPIFGTDGMLSMLLAISRDLTTEKSLQVQRELLSDELSHRVKNILAVVQAVAMQSFRGGDQAQLRAFIARLTTLGAAQALLVQTAWQSASILDVVERALAPHDRDGRCTIAGEPFELDGKRVLALALALHELATNAIKYGALSNDAGRVHVAWHAAAGQLHLTWTETGGPPVGAAGTPGFGTRIVTRNLAAEFKGTVDMQHKPSGVVLTLIAPLSSAPPASSVPAEPMEHS
jgi:two-component sensor histidine kinase